MYKKNNFLSMYLGKVNLIEASAGTGKTNLISLLYLRLLLGINIKKKFSNLLIKNILIVTFTDLATLEIKNRILDNIKNLRLSCIRGYPINNIIKDFYFYIKNIPNIINLLISYEYYIDSISVFTIHSFCKKILYSNFIESNIDYNTTIIDNENDLIYEIIISFWRKYFGSLSQNIVKIILKMWISPIKLFDFLLPILNFLYFPFSLKSKYFSIEDCYNKIIFFIEKFKIYWLLNYKNIYNFLVTQKIFNFLSIKQWFLEIKSWCKEKTINFILPYCLKKISLSFLIKKYNNIYTLKFFNLFKYIDKIFLKIQDFRNFIIIFCIKYIKNMLVKIKKKNAYISFNDLVINLNINFIKDKEYILINIIRKNFPILLIDEFQDTDFLQYNIFYKIYINNFTKLNTKLILIGDPKQSIYTFRGANIFNYIKAKKHVDFLYTLNINWRSSINLVKSINYLFNRINNPFIFKEIKYLNIKYSSENNFSLIKDNKKDFSIIFFIFKNLDKKKWKYNLSKVCAMKLCYLLNNKNKFLFNGNTKRLIIPSDIAILVHTNYEVKLIFDALQKYNLPIDTTLEKSNIFHTNEAKEIFFLLKSIINPNSVTLLSSALSTSFFNFNFNLIKNILSNKIILNKWVNIFYFYQNIWKKDGILVMIKYILDDKKNKKVYKINNQLSYNNILHIGEILEKKFFSLRNEFLLIYWLNDKILNTNINKKDYYIRSLNYENGIKISTIHKSKGLQYNIVWLPFLLNFKINNNYFIFHNRKNYKINIDLYKLKKNYFFNKEEIDSEEMRLFYVAITRSIYQCNIFLYEILDVKKNKFCDTYLGRLLNYNKEFSFNEIKKNIVNYFKCKYINFYFLDFIYFINKKKIFFKKKINNEDIFFSISKNRKYVLNFSNILNDKLQNNLININNFEFKKKDSFFLPKGKNIGNFFHKILEKINFLNSLDNDIILYYMLKFNISKIWFFCIKRILFNFLNVKLFNNISINNKKISFFYKEFDFFLPIINSFNFKEFNKIITQYNCISKLNQNFKLNKNNFTGFLNGVIDLLCIYNNKYFIIDYKTNWLGYKYIDYINKKLYKIIILHRYDIQYLLYTLALHNYLKLNLKTYNYNINFGGIYYIFLRGLLLDNKNYSFTGIFYTKPRYSLIKKLSFFFKKR